MKVLRERVKWNASEVSNITLLLRCKIQTVKTSHLLKAQPQQHAPLGESVTFEFLISYETCLNRLVIICDAKFVNSIRTNHSGAKIL